MEVIVYNSKGEDTGKKVTLPEEVFGIEPNQHAIYLDVKQYLANQRQGTHKAKERAENAHSTRKLKKQKGTGGARAGSAKSPVFIGGGTIFGPRPRDYSFKLNKKVKVAGPPVGLCCKSESRKDFSYRQHHTGSTPHQGLHSIFECPERNGPQNAAYPARCKHKCCSVEP